MEKKEKTRQAVTSCTSNMKQLRIFLLIIIIVLYIGFLVTIMANVYATYSNLQIAFQSLSYS